MANNNDLFEALLLLAKEKGIDPKILIEKIQAALIVAIKREHPRNENINFDIDIEKGKFDVSIMKEVVEYEDLYDEAVQITVDEAQKISRRYRAGDIAIIKLDPKYFGRIAAMSAKQVIKQGIREVENDVLLEQWGGLQNEAISAKIIKVEPNTGNAILDINGNEVPLFKNEQIPGEVLEAGKIVKVYVSGLNSSSKRPTLKISRTDRELVKRLFEKEVPEIFDGIVEVKEVSREAGSRSKIAVISHDENVDALGACIGPSRSRISNVCKELNDEKIDVIIYSDDPAEFVKQALKPAEVVSVEIPDPEVRACTVLVPDGQLSLAIGNKGQNAKLAARLTGFKIDIKPESGFFEG